MSCGCDKPEVSSATTTGSYSRTPDDARPGENTDCYSKRAPNPSIVYSIFTNFPFLPEKASDIKQG